MAEIWYAGVDGCRGGWFVLLLRCSEEAVEEVRHRLCRSFNEVVELPERPQQVALDMPIGLLERARPGGRVCDQAARRLLGPRKSSVFSPPARPALAAYPDYPRAVAANGGGISLPAWNILPRIREVDARMTPDLQQRIVECHPELAFLALAGQPMRHHKKRHEGRAERLVLLRQHFGGWLPDPQALRESYGRDKLAQDDVLDACALALTARRIQLGLGRCLPSDAVSVDAKGLRREICY